MYKISKISDNIIGDKMKVKDLMNRNLIICSHNIGIVNLANIMKKYNIGFIPIEKNKKIIGVVTDRDIVINMISNKTDYDSSIEKYINNNVISIEENKSINECLNLMKKNKLKRLIVTTKNKIVGIISISDILNIYDEQDKIIDTIKSIWTIQKTNDLYKTEIDEFYL